MLNALREVGSPYSHIGDCNRIHKNAHGKNGACRLNGCRGRFGELIFVSALLLRNLHKLVLHHFLKQTHKHTHTHSWGGRKVALEENANVELSSANENSSATAPAWCKWLRKPQTTLKYPGFFTLTWNSMNRLKLLMTMTSLPAANSYMYLVLRKHQRCF